MLPFAEEVMPANDAFTGRIKGQFIDARDYQVMNDYMNNGQTSDSDATAGTTANGTFDDPANMRFSSDDKNNLLRLIENGATATEIVSILEAIGDKDWIADIKHALEATGNPAHAELAQELDEEYEPPALHLNAEPSPAFAPRFAA